MTIVSEGPLCLKIHLSKYELKKYFNGYREINIENTNTRKTTVLNAKTASLPVLLKKKLYIAPGSNFEQNPMEKSTRK